MCVVDKNVMGVSCGRQRSIGRLCVGKCDAAFLCLLERRSMDRKGEKEGEEMSLILSGVKMVEKI